MSGRPQKKINHRDTENTEKDEKDRMKNKYSKA